MIIRAVSGGIFGAFTGSSWKESGSFYGKDDVFLFQIDPCVGVYRPRSLSGGSNFMYCNSFARSKGYDGQAHGKIYLLLIYILLSNMISPFVFQELDLEVLLINQDYLYRNRSKSA